MADQMKFRVTPDQVEAAKAKFSSVQGPSGLSRESYRESYCLFL